ncbi:MAG: tRNA (adenosine(37)-N6)-threonylcarbamoyltransferase complex dimerization subunit type 1 TsaB [Chthoniobacterales bacterium]
MKILSLDSSTQVSSVAFVDFHHPENPASGEPLVGFLAETSHTRSDSSALFAALQQAVESCGKPEALCVGLGPGSYNGLRASIAATRGFATALGIPLHAIPSPLALAGPDSGFWALGDARGGHYWIARVSEGAFLEEPALLSPQETAIHLQNHPDLPILSATPLAGIEGIVIVTPSAVRLAILAKRGDPSSFVPGTPEPLYLKPPHITAPKTRTLPLSSVS